MTEQPAALKLAYELDGIPLSHMTEALADDAAAELRRLHQQYRSAVQLIQSIAYEPHELSLDKAYDQRNWMQKTCRVWLQQNSGENQ